MPVDARKMGGILLMTEESTRSLQLKLRECCLGRTSTKLASGFARSFAALFICNFLGVCVVRAGVAVVFGS